MYLPRELVSVLGLVLVVVSMLLQGTHHATGTGNGIATAPRDARSSTAPRDASTSHALGSHSTGDHMLLGTCCTGSP